MNSIENFFVSQVNIFMMSLHSIFIEFPLHFFKKRIFFLQSSPKKELRFSTDICHIVGFGGMTQWKLSHRTCAPLPDFNFACLDLKISL